MQRPHAINRAISIHARDIRLIYWARAARATFLEASVAQYDRASIMTIAILPFTHRRARIRDRKINLANAPRAGAKRAPIHRAAMTFSRDSRAAERARAPKHLQHRLEMDIVLRRQVRLFQVFIQGLRETHLLAPINPHHRRHNIEIKRPRHHRDAIAHAIGIRADLDSYVHKRTLAVCFSRALQFSRVVHCARAPAQIHASKNVALRIVARDLVVE
ncbi:MAG: hypothetical protein M0R66_09675 [Candidatus Omnitrophica bacterium]|nr:hypothetical protein [Candidatus Omnitrophota bacterium]